MPIDEDEWNSGKTAEAPDTTEEQVLAFLKHSKQAFTHMEIQEAVKGEVSETDAGSLFVNIMDSFGVQGALDKLVKDGKVEKRRIKTESGTQTYYKAL